MQPNSTLTHARNLRKNLTPAEAKLWQALRGKRLDGLRFRRQHPIGPYVLDFYCPSSRLAVELDGEAHMDEEARWHDSRRDSWLYEQGLSVLRLANALVLSDLDEALQKIANACGR